jgi:hypothetical protein
MNRFIFNLVGVILAVTASASALAEDSDAANFAITISKIVVDNDGKTICAPRGSKLIDYLFPIRVYMSEHPEQTLTNVDIHKILSKAFPCPSDASTKKNDIEPLREQGYSVKTISPIFGQLVMFSFPKGFTTVFENTNGANYIRESVLAGENVKKWSQMVTVTGAKGLSENPNVTPQAFANNMAGRFKNVCPTSFAGSGLGAFKVGSYDAFAAVIGCGVANATSDPYSESMLLIVIKGESDYYTIQWAEQGASSTTPIKFDEAKWTSRFKDFMPIRLCPIVPGESAPYPSCVGRGRT